MHASTEIRKAWRQLSKAVMRKRFGEATFLAEYLREELDKGEAYPDNRDLVDRTLEYLL